MATKAKGAFVRGTGTFIPNRPPMIVGMAITMVMAARYFITLFRRLEITELISSLVPVIISL